MPRDVMPIMSDRDLALTMADRSGGFGQGMGGPGPVTTNTPPPSFEEPAEEPFVASNIQALIESSGEINPAGQFTEEWRVPSSEADPSIAQGPVGYAPTNFSDIESYMRKHLGKNDSEIEVAREEYKKKGTVPWYELSKSEYPFIPQMPFHPKIDPATGLPFEGQTETFTGGQYYHTGPEGSPRIVYNMRVSDDAETFEHHERFHDAGNTLSKNMGYWGPVTFENKKLEDVMAPNGEWDRELFHMVIYSQSPNPQHFSRIVNNEEYKNHPFFSDVKTDEEKLEKIQRLAVVVDQAAGNILNSFNQGTMDIKGPRSEGVIPWNWGEGAASSYSPEQAQGIIGRK